MKISFLYPEQGVHPGDRNWMFFVAKELEKKGHEVLLNVCDDSCDVILGMSIGVIGKIQRAHAQHPNVPLITYNWDMHPMLEPLVGKWNENGWDKLMEDSIDVWTQTKYHADFSKELTGIDHYVMPICALDFEFEDVKPTTGDYALMASRRVPYKGFEMFEKACSEMRIKYVSRHPEYGGRDDYVDVLSKCKCLVVASEEEANSPMSAYEGAFCKKVLLLSDIEANVEEWGDTAVYFKNKDSADFKNRLRDVFAGRYNQKALMSYELAKKKFTVEAFVNRINKRLCEVL